MIGTTAERARATVESAARRAPDASDGRRRARVNRRAVAERRRRGRARITLRGVIARPARGRGAAGLRHALGAIGLLALLVLAILPAHASGLTPGSAARSRPVGRPLAEEGEVSSIGAALATSVRSEEAGLGAVSGPANTRPSILALSTPPTIGWYQLAATEQAVSMDLLRALHQVESNAAPDGCVANAQGSGALGPFQLKPATFRAYGVDANHDGRRDICSFADALFSAARYLRTLGATDLDDPATRLALTRYGTDPDRVLSLALSYRNRATQAN